MEGRFQKNVINSLPEPISDVDHDGKAVGLGGNGECCCLSLNAPFYWETIMNRR